MNSKFLVIILLVLSICCFIAGLWFPILATKNQILGFVISYKEVKLFDSVVIFYESSDFFIAAVIFIFTFLFPSLKYLDLLNRLFTLVKLPDRIGAFLMALDKWSMLDVFLVALLLLNFKMDSNIIVMKLKMGTSFIAMSVLFRMVSSHMLALYKR